MSDQDPVYAPPPDYSPSPAPSNYGPDAFGASAQQVQQAPQPNQPAPGSSNKRKVILIVGIVVAVLMLCCCLGAAGLALFAVDSGTTTTDSGRIDILEPDADDARMQEWLIWAPESPAMLSPAPAELEPLITEALGIVAPGLSFAEAVRWDGYYDEAEDWYYADAYYVRAVHPSSDSVSAGVDLWMQSDLMIAEVVPFEPDPSTDTVVTVAGGSRELLYLSQWGAGFDLATDDDVALWEQIGRDWPGAVVVNGFDAEDGSGSFSVSITKWELYAVDTDYATVLATYSLEGGEWTLLQWEYRNPDGSDGSSSS
ncbi:MAG: hypothetical protein U1E29_13330 [Coriobacteriia bacterium]|nr:hypothetical protein [Coriobacteriia bacterium]